MDFFSPAHHEYYIVCYCKEGLLLSLLAKLVSDSYTTFFTVYLTGETQWADYAFGSHYFVLSPL